MSDAELTLFDALFDSVIVSFSALSLSHFGDFSNLPYGHGLSDEELQSVLDRLTNAHLLERNFDRNRPVYSLTPQGGALWELEREPRWELYCSSSAWQEEDQPGYWQISVQSIDAKLGEMELQTAADCGLHDNHPIEEITIHALPDQGNMPAWKKFPIVYEARTQCAIRHDDDPYIPHDWECYHSRRRWWQSVMDLANLPLL